MLQELQRPGQTQHSSSWVDELKEPIKSLPVSQKHAQNGQEEQLQTLVGAGTAVMVAAEACLVSALARMVKVADGGQGMSEVVTK